MTGASMPERGRYDGAGLRVGIAVSRFNEHVTRRLLTGARDALRRCGVADDAVEVAWAPGAFDLPVVAQALALSGRYDAVVCLGCVIRGETTHDRYVALGAAVGLTRVALDARLPVTLGVLTTETLAQAEDRSGGAHGNKGEDAALAAVELVNTLRGLRPTGPDGGGGAEGAGAR
jgi:6,7-dimethyl-8-ribityllumazine synthase